MSEDARRILSVILLVGAGYYAGAMFNFFPFTMWNGTAVGAIGFSTLLIGVVIVYCTNEILAAIKGTKEPTEKDASEEDPTH